MIRWAMHKLGVEEWLVSAVMSMYTSAKKQMKEHFMVTVTLKVGMHRGSALSPLLFVIVMEAVLPILYR